MSAFIIIPLAQLRPKNRKVKVKPPETTPEIISWPAYMCPELGRTCTRAGAYDAFDLPSVYAGERKPYRFSQEK